jgi:small subunit ribosomal protein S2
MYYVTERWLGGMLTNFKTVKQSVSRLHELDRMATDGTFDILTKREVASLERERSKLEKVFSGIKDMRELPAALFVVDTKKERIAVMEANRLGIPVIGVVDTNCDPDVIDYPIPGNDDAIRSVALLTRVIADAVADGLVSRAGAAAGDAKPETVEPGAAEPLPEWERELLSGDATAAVEPAPAAEAPAAEVPAAEAPVAEAPAATPTETPAEQS